MESDKALNINDYKKPPSILMAATAVSNKQNVSKEMQMQVVPICNPEIHSSDNAAVAVGDGADSTDLNVANNNKSTTSNANSRPVAVDSMYDEGNADCAVDITNAIKNKKPIRRRRFIKKDKWLKNGSAVSNGANSIENTINNDSTEQLGDVAYNANNISNIQQSSNLAFTLSDIEYPDVDVKQRKRTSGKTKYRDPPTTNNNDAVAGNISLVDRRHGQLMRCTEQIGLNKYDMCADKRGQSNLTVNLCQQQEMPRGLQKEKQLTREISVCQTQSDKKKTILKKTAKSNSNTLEIQKPATSKDCIKIAQTSNQELYATNSGVKATKTTASQSLSSSTTTAAAANIKQKTSKARDKKIQDFEVCRSQNIMRPLAKIQQGAVTITQPDVLAQLFQTDLIDTTVPAACANIVTEAIAGTAVSLKPRDSKPSGLKSVISEIAKTVADPAVPQNQSRRQKRRNRLRYNLEFVPQTDKELILTAVELRKMDNQLEKRPQNQAPENFTNKISDFPALPKPLTQSKTPLSHTKKNFKGMMQDVTFDQKFKNHTMRAFEMSAQSKTETMPPADDVGSKSSSYDDGNAGNSSGLENDEMTTAAATAASSPNNNEQVDHSLEKLDQNEMSLENYRTTVTQETPNLSLVLSPGIAQLVNSSTLTISETEQSEIYSTIITQKTASLASLVVSEEQINQSTDTPLLIENAENYALSEVSHYRKCNDHLLKCTASNQLTDYVVSNNKQVQPPLQLAQHMSLSRDTAAAVHTNTQIYVAPHQMSRMLSNNPEIPAAASEVFEASAKHSIFNCLTNDSQIGPIFYPLNAYAMHNESMTLYTQAANSAVMRTVDATFEMLTNQICNVAVNNQDTELSFTSQSEHRNVEMLQFDSVSMGSTDDNTELYGPIFCTDKSVLDKQLESSFIPAAENAINMENQIAVAQTNNEVNAGNNIMDEVEQLKMIVSNSQANLDSIYCQDNYKAPDLNLMPPSIKKLYVTIKNNFSDYAFVYALAAQLCTEHVPINSHIYLKMSLLLSLASFEPDESRPPISLFIIGSDTNLAHNLMNIIGQFAKRFIGPCDVVRAPSTRLYNSDYVWIEANAFNLAKGGVYFAGDWRRLKTTHTDFILKSIENSKIILETTNESQPLDIAIWSYWQPQGGNQDKTICDMCFKVFGLPIIIDDDMNEDMMGLTFLKYQKAPIDTNLTDSMRIPDEELKAYLEILSLRKIDMDNDATELLNKYFIVSRKVRVGIFSKQTYVMLKQFAESFAKLSFRTKVLEIDVVSAIFLCENYVQIAYGNENADVAPVPGFQVFNYVGQVDPKMLMFYKWLLNYIGKHYNVEICLPLWHEFIKEQEQQEQQHRAVAQE